MTLTEIGTITGIFVVGGGVIASYYRGQAKTDQKVQHLDDTKESKNGLGDQVSELDTSVQLLTQKIDMQSVEINRQFEEQGYKIAELFRKIPCMQPGWKKEDC